MVGDRPQLGYRGTIAARAGVTRRRTTTTTTDGGHDARDDDDETRGDDDDDDERYDALVNAEIRARAGCTRDGRVRSRRINARTMAFKFGWWNFKQSSKRHYSFHFIHSFIHGCRSRG